MNKYDPFWQHRELERLLAQARPMFDILNSLPPSFFENMRQLEELNRKFSLPSEYLSLSDEIQRMMDASNLASSLPALYQRDRGVIQAFESIQRQLSTTFAAIKGLDPILCSISNSIAESLVGAEALIKGMGFQPADMSVLTRTHDSFKKFAMDKLALLDSESEIFRANTATAVAEAARLLPGLAYVSELSALMAAPIVAELQGLPGVNVFGEIDYELGELDFEAEGTDVVSAIEESSTSKTVEVGGRLVRLVFEINTAAERSGENYVFKPTTKTMYAFHQIPTTVASEERLFMEVVDALFFLLYEGSGDAARLTSKYDTTRLDALWLLKHLRLGARHDLDHGNGTKANKKFEQVGAAYNELIGMPLPKAREDWKSAQLVLYERIVAMLEDIWLNGP